MKFDLDALRSIRRETLSRPMIEKGLSGASGQRERRRKHAEPLRHGPQAVEHDLGIDSTHESGDHMPQRAKA